jgi:hypothetical protein
MKIQKITLLDKSGREREIDFKKTSVAYRAKIVLTHVARMIAPNKK